MGLDSSNPGGYATTGGLGRGSLPDSASGAPATYAPPTARPLAVTPIASPARPYAGVMPSPRPASIAADAARAVSHSLTTAALSSQSAPSVGFGARSVVLRATLAQFTGASPNLNPLATTTTESPLPVPRLLLAGALVVGGLAAGGVGRWVAVAGAALGVSALYTFVRSST